ncbi:Putative MetA-pathway of phenol degradation [Dokdonia pacifica]|uniref:Putative MetA-pathway of phenol degradation n=2 Tax=Dokdonia pacifica TaxID=1627892 RepID=A0A238WVV5_9FLAO|nr:Putative MetA-pathway of phenol degradation [Dokdonia pacifica]
MCLLGFSIQLVAQETETTPDLVTDRPDATEAPTVVPVGSLQVETGALTTSFEDNGIKEEVFTYNTTLLRYGILDNLELRIGWNFEEVQTTINGMESNDVASGLSPLLFGAKVAITEEKGWFPEIGLIGHIFLPFTASSDFKPEFTAADFRFSFNHTLSERSGIAYNLGGQLGGESAEFAYIYTLAYGYSITDKLGAYVEVYGDLPEDSSANHFWDAGLTYAIAPLIQLDATVGQSITEGQDILLSAGVSFRIDKK